MRKKIGNKVLPIFLCAVMVVTFFTGCNYDNNPAELPDVPDLIDDGTDSWMHHTADYTIDWYVDLSFFSYPNSGKDVISSVIKEKTGATINFVTPLDDTGQLLSTMIAGDSLPDVITLRAEAPQVHQLAMEDYIWPMDTLAEKWAPSLLRRLESDVRAYWTFGDGHLYGLPSLFYSEKYLTEESKFAPNGALLVRKDWLEWYMGQPGSEDIDTPSGLIKAMKAVKNQFGSTVNNFSGLLLDSFKENGNVSLIYLSQYFAAPYEDAQGNYLDVRTTEKYQEMLEFLNSAYADGLVNRSNLTANMDAIAGVISRGEAFVTVNPPQDYYYSYVNAYNNDIEYVPLLLRNEAGDDPVIQDLTGNGFLFNMITKKASNVDNIIKLFDFLYSEEGNRLIMMGIEGDTWNWTDETKTKTEWTPKYLEMKKAGTLSNYGINCLTVFANLAYLDPIMSRQGKTVQETYFENMKRPIMPYCYSYGISWPPIDSSSPGYLTQIKNRGKFTAIWAQYLPDIISKPDYEDLYDKCIEAMNRRGFREYLSFYNTAYKAHKQRLGVTYGWPLNNPNYRSPKLRNTDGSFSENSVGFLGDSWYLYPMPQA